MEQFGSNNKLSCKKTMMLLMLVSVVAFILLFEHLSARLVTNRNVGKWFVDFDQSWINLYVGRENKNILIWNSPDRIETAAFGLGHEPFLKNGCKITECVVYNQNSSILPLEEYDAIIINMHEIWSTELPSFNRRGHQRVIFLTQESPSTMTIDFTPTTNYFNWTMTYRRDSDIQLLYGRIEPGPTAPKSPEEAKELIKKMHLPSAKNYASNKTHKVAWMVSNCNTESLRETYVRELSKFIPVDIYGRCGNLSCSLNSTHWLSDPSCYDMLEAKYKFYLSFENSICRDYVTEKFFEIMNRNIVPVVLGGASYNQIAPSHSYINAQEFTPEQLANYLKVLDTDDKLYNEYFWWKDYYRLEVGVEQMARHGFCDLCEKLHQDEGKIKYYREVISEWNPENRCTRMSTSWESSP